MKLGTPHVSSHGFSTERNLALGSESTHHQLIKFIILISNASQFHSYVIILFSISRLIRCLEALKNFATTGIDQI